MTYLVDWQPTDARVRASWNNETDTTEIGACGIALGLVETDLGLTALGRVRPGGGADYWVGPPGSEVNEVDGELDFQEALRLEVSGIEKCASEAVLLQRLARKVKQVQQAGADEGLAVVVAFSLLRAVLRVA